MPTSRTTAPARDDPYAAIAAYYDLEHGHFDEDVQMTLDFALATGDPVLEIGCGTGRLLGPLLAAGHRVTGLDRSEAMLDRARDALARDGFGDRVRLVVAEATAAARDERGTYGLVILALNGLMHLETPAAQRRTLAAARAALDPRGLLLLDMVNPTPDVLRGFEPGVIHEGHWELSGGGQVDKFASRIVRHESQQIETRLWYDRVEPDGSFHRTTAGFTLRWVTRAELELMLELAGFADWQVYGSYDLDPFDARSDRLIVAAEASPSPLSPGGPTG
ncbi:MAG: class I SAM-dependent methyltransferase [Chloroflexia bacterium]|nr:class I SAM-dependent methyltransferase [Chloroflexia bacterium]